MKAEQGGLALHGAARELEEPVALFEARSLLAPGVVLEGLRRERRGRLVHGGKCTVAGRWNTKRAALTGLPSPATIRAARRAVAGAPFHDGGGMSLEGKRALVTGRGITRNRAGDRRGPG